MTELPSKELLLLVDRLLNDGGLRRVEVRRLEDLLREDGAALDCYTRTMAQEGLMALALNGLCCRDEIPSRVPSLRAVVAAALTTATAACVAVWLSLSGDSVRVAPGSYSFAGSGVRVTALASVEWEGGRSAVLPDGSLASEHVALRSGFAELTYPSGVRLVLEGPSVFAVGGLDSGFLTRGRLVAHVPPGAEGFTIGYGGGRVVDLGTEFGFGVEDGKMQLSVFDGSIELDMPDRSPRALNQGQAVRHDGGVNDPLHDIAQNEVHFVRELSGWNLPWRVDPRAAQSIEFDVSRFIAEPSDYLVVFKWTSGSIPVAMGGLRLLLDGRCVAGKTGSGATGNMAQVCGNAFRLRVSAGDFTRGRWVLQADVTPERSGDLIRNPEITGGLLLFESGFALRSSEEDFIGRWSYHFNGRNYVREFHENGRASLEINGNDNQVFHEDSRWSYENGVLSLWYKNHLLAERHILRDPETLVFISNRYPDAVRIPEK